MSVIVELLLHVGCKVWT